MKGREVGPRILYIPDTQIKPDVPTEHIAWAARYAAAKRPDVIVLAGDWYDMPSLSSYDRGKLSAEGRRYADDIKAGDDALELWQREFDHALGRGVKAYSPRRIVTLGNHEDRISRAVDDDPRMADTMSLSDLSFDRYGWVQYQFLRPVDVHGITFLHYCPLNATGRVAASRFGAPSAIAQARRMMRSTVCGHRQGLDVATLETPGRRVRGVIAGSFYQHEEKYLTPVGESYWRGVLMLNDIHRGDFDLCEVSLDYLRRRYG